MKFFKIFIGGLILIGCLTGNIFAGEIHEAAKAGDLEKIKSIIESNRSRLMVQDKYGYTALHWSAIRAQWDVVKYLVEAGADVNAFALNENAPLHCAANHNNVAIVGLLIKKGSVVDKKNILGNTPLHVACQAGNKKVAKILVFQGAKVNGVSNEGWTPLHYAQMSGHSEMAAQLRRQKASLEIEDSSGKTADEYKFRRPKAIEIDLAKLEEYTGKYSVDNNFISKVWVEDDKLWFEDYAIHPTYPIGVDSFFCEKQPWTISFTRDENGEVDSISIVLLRQTAGGVKVADDFELTADASRLGLTTRQLLRFELSYGVLKSLYRLETPSDTIAASATFVLENSPADRAGIKQRDIILMFNNDPVMNSEDLIRLIEKVEPKAKVPVEIYRRGNVLSLTINFE